MRQESKGSQAIVQRDHDGGTRLRDAREVEVARAGEVGASMEKNKDGQEIAGASLRHPDVDVQAVFAAGERGVGQAALHAVRPEGVRSAFSGPGAGRL